MMRHAGGELCLVSPVRVQKWLFSGTTSLLGGFAWTDRPKHVWWRGVGLPAILSLALTLLQEGKDEDIMQEPFFYLRPPSVTGRPDAPTRRFQHWYGYPLYGFTFVLWRLDSIRSVVARRDWKVVSSPLLFPTPRSHPISHFTLSCSLPTSRCPVSFFSHSHHHHAPLTSF